ncbi:MAG TPA: carboxypeptidase-like regulatory domain-containing protein [Bryobacteraceae bacterium]|nr:carboxypeptidase-like regulatory domain-containing protein [Bryobacteraceae bacterium]
MKFVLLSLLAASLMLPRFSYAQTGNASLAGAVRDASGAVVPGAQVTVRNTQTGVARVVVTNNAGAYYTPNLIPGQYEVLVKATGFQDTTITGIQLVIDQEARIDVDLRLGSVGTEVTITGAPPLLQTEEASVGTVIGSQQVTDLPLNGREFTQLLQLSPGTVPAIYSNLYKSNDPAQAGRQRNGMPAFEVNGGNAAFTTFRLDGVDNSESEFGGANIPVSVDAIGEVKIQTANFSSEYGRGPSQVDVTSKAGTNQIHGTLFEFLRNDLLDAAPWAFTGPHIKNTLKRNQFGGSVGGPVKRDKLFYFFNYEGKREVFSQPQSTTVPTDDNRKGIFPSGVLIFDPTTGKQFPNNTIPADRVDPISKQILEVFPAANQPGIQNVNKAGFQLEPTLNYFYNPRRLRNINQYNVRVDYNLSTKDTFFVRYTDGSNIVAGDGPLSTNLGSIIGTETDQLGGRNLSGTWFHSFGPATINEVRFGVSTDPQLYDTSIKTDYAKQWGLDKFLSPDAPPGLPSIMIGSTSISSGNTRPFHVSETNWQAVDNLTLVHGSHSIRLGFEYYRAYRNPFNPARSRGQLRFSGAQTRDRNFPTVATTFCPGGTVNNACTAGDPAADFLLGALSFFEAGSPESAVDKHFATYSGYVWDTWRVRSNFTVNLGLRYDYHGRMTSDPYYMAIPLLANGEFTGKVAVANTSGNKFPALVPASALAAFPGSIITCRDAGLSDNCVTVQKTQLQPRVGFAWQINNKTVFRGGAGTFYGHVLGDYETEEGSATFPYILDLQTQTFTRPPAGTAPPPLLLSNPTAGLSLPAPSVTAMPANRKDPSTYQWNFSLEREFMKNSQVSAAWVSVLGRNVGNLPPTQCCFYNLPGPIGVVLAPGQQQVQPFPQFSVIEYYSYQSTSNYQSLQVKYNRRFSDGLTATLAYTWSKSMGVTVGAADPRYPTKSLLPNDVPQILTLSPIWEIPVGAGHRLLNHKGVVNQVLGGWRLSGILSLRSGFPFTPTLSGTNLLNDSASHNHTELPDRICNGAISNPTVFNWFDKSCFAMPVEPTTPGALLHQGNSGMFILRAPGAFSLDLGISKRFAFTERIALEFRAEAFNALNHPTFGMPNANIAPLGNSPASQITTTSNLPRIGQFALKLHF